jgi:ankyrin repeat protein
VNGWTALHDAVSVGSLPVVKALLAHGADPKKPDVTGSTPISLARSKNLNDIVFSLTHVSAVIAAGKGDKATLQQLLDSSGVDVNHQDLDHGMTGETLLHRAAFVGNTEIVKELLLRGADMTLKNSVGWSPFDEAVYAGKADIVEELLQSKKINVDDRDISGATALHRAVIRGHKDIAARLVKLGVNVNNKARHDVTALHEAAATGNLDITKLLVEAGAKIDSPTSNGWTPLFEAANAGQETVIKYLLQKGASTKATDVNGKTPKDIARDNVKNLL